MRDAAPLRAAFASPAVQYLWPAEPIQADAQIIARHAACHEQPAGRRLRRGRPHETLTEILDPGAEAHPKAPLPFLPQVHS